MSQSFSSYGSRANRSRSSAEGGSGPEADLAEILGAPLVFVGVALDSDQIHAPNERIDLSLLLRGAEASAYLWEELASVGSDLT